MTDRRSAQENTPAAEIVTLLRAQPMVTIGLLTMTQEEYELLMLRVRAALLRTYRNSDVS